MAQGLTVCATLAGGTRSIPSITEGSSIHNNSSQAIQWPPRASTSPTLLSRTHNSHTYPNLKYSNKQLHKDFQDKHQVVCPQISDPPFFSTGLWGYVQKQAFK